MNKKVGRNKPCHCGSGKKFKMCCDSHNTNLDWGKKKDNVKNTDIVKSKSYYPRTIKGKIDFDQEFERLIENRFKTFDEFGGEKFKDVLTKDWLGDIKPYSDDYKISQETWNDTKDEWIDSFKRTHDRWRFLFTDDENESIISITSPINVSNGMDIDSNQEMELNENPIIGKQYRDTKYYEQMVKEYDDICFDKLVLDKVKKVENGGWFKWNKNKIIKLRTCDVDIDKTTIWCVFNDYCYSHLEWLNKWKEELIEMIPTHLIGMFLKDWYFKLGLPLNKVELKEGHIDELLKFITKLKEVDDTTWEELGMNMSYDFFHSKSGKGLEQWGGRNFVIMIQPKDNLEGLIGGNDKGITTMSDDESITIYRNVLDLKYKDGFSWSTDSSQSLKWGLSRNYVGCGKDKGYLLEGEVIKKDIMGFTNRNGDKGGMNEVFVHPSKVTITNTFELTEDSIVDILKTHSVVRKDLLHQWLSGFNVMFIKMWDKVCEFSDKQDISLMKQTFLSRMYDVDEKDRENIIESIKNETLVMNEVGESKRRFVFKPQTKMDKLISVNKKVMKQIQEKCVMFQNQLIEDCIV
jgi:hypothetical protein